jgi:uncharacterized protein
MRFRSRVLPTPPSAPPVKPAAVSPAPGRTPAGTPTSTKAQAAVPHARAAVELPPILFEGDQPTPPPPSGPGERYILGPTLPPPQAPAVEKPTELPQGYGTERLFLTARDPHWLYAAWDLTAEQRQRYNSSSSEGHLAIRTYVNNIGDRPESETRLQPETKSWFIPVIQAGARYAAQLGYYDRQGQWRAVASSAATLTPAESASSETAVEFATIPPDVSLKRLFETVQQALSENVPLLEAVQQLRAEGWTQLPELRISASPRWTPAQERALGALVRLDDSRQVWMGSLEITEVIRRHLRPAVSSEAQAVGAGLPGSARQAVEAAAISSPLGQEEKGVAAAKPFWLNINAELVLYGATEPNANVLVGGRQIRLRPDGTFSYRFALPDGQYPLQVTAASADGEDRRSVQLHFARSTQFQGDVRAHEQDARLTPPVESAVA